MSPPLLAKTFSRFCSILMTTCGAWFPIKLTESMSQLLLILMTTGLACILWKKQRPCSRCCAALMTLGGTWLSYRTNRGCASAVYISRDNKRSMLSNKTIRDYAAVWSTLKTTGGTVFPTLQTVAML